MNPADEDHLPEGHRFCPNCGSRGVLGALFCGDCGTALMQAPSSGGQQSSSNQPTVWKCPNCGMEWDHRIWGECTNCHDELSRPGSQGGTFSPGWTQSAFDAHGAAVRPQRISKQSDFNVYRADPQHVRAPKKSNTRDRLWVLWFFGLVTCIILVIVGTHFSTNPDGTASDNAWGSVDAIGLLAGGFILILPFLVWFGRQFKITIGSETPREFQRAQEKVQQEALQKLGRYLTLEEMQQWAHDRKTDALVSVGVVGGIVALHSWNQPKR